MDNKELVAKLRALPPREICEHGSQRVKCVHCDNTILEARVAELEEENAQLCTFAVEALGISGESLRATVRSRLAADQREKRKL